MPLNDTANILHLCRACDTLCLGVCCISVTRTCSERMYIWCPHEINELTNASAVGYICSSEDETVSIALVPGVPHRAI